MVTNYVVMVRRWDPAERVIIDEPYTGHVWREDQELEAQDERWDADHDELVDTAYIQEVTA